jgi:predicted CXXCH cytochrome family protein
MEMRLLRTALLFVLLLSGVTAHAQEPACLECHRDFKDAKVVHPALTMGCSSCHAGLHAGEKPAPKLTVAVPDLCFGCHDKAAFEKKAPHAPVAGGMCVSCHNPHASAVPKLLRAPVPDLCFSCHDRNAMAKKTVHASAAGGQCLVCHNPHGSDSAFVLTQLVEGHCESCHEEQASGRHVMIRVSPGDMHPVKGKADPLRPGKELSCVSCHNPHVAGPGSQVAEKAKRPEAVCRQCHRKIKIGP